MKRALILLVTMVAGCATVNRTTAEVDELTRCPITLQQAEMNLVRAGYPITASNDRYVQTGYRQVASTDAISEAFLGARYVSSYRLTVTPAGKDVRWAAFVQGQRTSGQLSTQPVGNSSSEQPLDPYRMHQKEIDLVRKAVCGHE